jgi:hypothetical protein
MRNHLSGKPSHYMEDVMKVVKVFFSKSVVGKDHWYCSCDVEIPGVGKLEITDCLSEETMERVFNEVEVMARLKLHMEDIVK